MIFRLALGIIGAVVLSAAPAIRAAEIGDLHKSYLFTPTGEMMPYRLYVPRTYTPDHPSGLVVILHGGNNDEDAAFEHSDLRAIAEARGYILLGVRGYNKNGGYGDTYPIVVTRSTLAAALARPAPKLGDPPRRAPFAPLGKPVSIPVPLEDYAELPPGELIDSQLGLLSELETLAALAEVRRQYAIDPRRLYLMGNSMGGVGTLYLGAKYANLWAAISPSAGAVAAWSYPFGRLKEEGVSVIFVHGELDEHANPHWSQLMAKKAQEAGVDAKVIVVPGASHKLGWTQASAAVFDFFDQHQRKPAAPAP